MKNEPKLVTFNIYSWMGLSAGAVHYYCDLIPLYGDKRIISQMKRKLSEHEAAQINERLRFVYAYEFYLKYRVSPGELDYRFETKEQALAAAIQISRRAASDNYGKYKEKADRNIPLDMTYPQSILNINTANVGERGLHPTQKPVALCKYLILTYTNQGDTVLDIAMGSGTTGVASIQLQRNFIGIEIEKKYFNIAQKRVQEAQNQLHLPLGDLG